MLLLVSGVKPGHHAGCETLDNGAGFIYTRFLVPEKLKTFHLNIIQGLSQDRPAYLLDRQFPENLLFGQAII